MYDPRYRISWVTAAIAALGLSIVPHGAFAENAAPALAAFEQAFASVNDYAVVERVHEVKGTASQNRTYEVWFMKPHFAKTLIQAGDGKGSGGVWAGGDQVSGHQGGLFSGVHLKVSHPRSACGLAARHHDSRGPHSKRRPQIRDHCRDAFAGAGREDRRRFNRPSRPQSRQSHGQRRRFANKFSTCRKKRIGRFVKSSMPATRSFSTRASPTSRRTPD